MGLFDSVVDRFNGRSTPSPSPPSLASGSPSADAPEGFGSHLFAPAAPAAQPTRYALWWATPAEPCFVGSPTHEALARTYRALDGVESYVFGAFLRRLGGSGHAETVRAALPQGMVYLDVEGPARVGHVLTASFDKGIRFHHPQGFPACADFARALADYAEGWAGQVAENGWPRDPAGEVRPLEWLETLSRTLGKAEARGDRFAAVGVVDHAPGMRKVELDALARTERGLVPTEVPTDAMRRLHAPILMARMEIHAALVAGKRTPFP